MANQKAYLFKTSQTGNGMLFKTLERAIAKYESYCINHSRKPYNKTVIWDAINKNDIFRHSSTHVKIQKVTIWE